jgi:Cu+-exporting ATPase
MAVAALAVVLWLVFGPGLAEALVAGVSVLIIACPCAMGLATPTSILVGSGRAAELGLLFRKAEALQALSGVRAVAFDKTGTLTEGKPALTDIAPMPDFTADEVLRLAGALEAKSEHPVGAAILAEARSRGLDVPKAEAFQAVAGHGVEGTVEGRSLLAGSARFLKAKGVDLTQADRSGTTAQAMAEAGKTPILVAVDGVLAGLLAVSDPIKPGSAEAVQVLKDQGIAVVMITGDTDATARAVATRLGIDEVVAGVAPGEKQDALRALRERLGPVAFVGDGINDAPSLAAADVGIAIGTGTDVAIEAADLVLMGGDPRLVGRGLALSRAVLRNIRQNLLWAFGYNAALIPVAAGLLYPFGGPLLSPMLAAGAMALSSVFVVTNALRLRRFGR